MHDESPHTYQSGERVPYTTTYVVAGIHLAAPSHYHESPVQLLYEGNQFPDYGGRAVQWVIRQIRPLSDDEQNPTTNAHSGV